MIKKTQRTIKTSRLRNGSDQVIRFTSLNGGKPGVYKTWFVATDICKHVGLAVRSTDGQPNVTVATNGVVDDDNKVIIRIDTSENINNPWLDVMALNYEGANQMTKAHLNKPFDHFINQMEVES